MSNVEMQAQYNYTTNNSATTSHKQRQTMKALLKASNISIASNLSAPCLRRTTTQRLPQVGLVCACALALTLNSMVAADVPLEVTAAASNGLPTFLANVPTDSKPLYGFAEDADFSKARLASPLLLHTIKPSALSSNQPNDTVSSVASETSIWFFPVLMGADVKAMLVVDRQDNEWKAVSLGYAPLAREWNQVLNQWPASKGFHPQLIAVFQAKQFYFTVPEIGGRNLTPLLSPWNAGASTKAAPLGAEQSSANYSRLGTLSIELAKLRTTLKRVGLGTGR